MTPYQFRDDSGEPLDAHFEVREGTLVLHSRGGAIGSPNVRNTEYGPALRILLKRINQSALTLTGVWVDSARVQNLPEEERQIFSPEDTEVPLSELFTQLSNKMAAVGRDPNSRSRRGNSNKRLRFAFAGNPPADRIARIVGRGGIDTTSGWPGKIPASVLNRVGTDHIRRAVQRLVSSSVNHPFGESTDYDVIAEDGSRLPPKAVFGLAATEALGYEILPRHFVGGSGTLCFKAITDAGYRIVRKDKIQPDEVPPDEVSPNPDDHTWVEGHPKLVTHLRRERKPGLAAEKKDVFRREHGRLQCECCGLDPAKTYGPDIGDACIEVHHKLPVANMPPGHETHLDELKCVCANCHRIIHHKLRNAL